MLLGKMLPSRRVIGRLSARLEKKVEIEKNSFLNKKNFLKKGKIFSCFFSPC